MTSFQMMLPTLVTWFGIAVALVYLPMTENAPSWPRTAIKTVPMLSFALATAIWGGPAMLIAALVLSALGDFALSRRGEPAFLGGLSAFALAHVAYAIVFLGLSGAPLWSAFVQSPIAALFLVFITLSTELWLTPHLPRGLRWPVRAYALVITVMGLAAFTLPLGGVAAGALNFIASDLLLAIQMFRMSEDHPLQGRTGWLIWVLYVVGQLMMFSAVLA